MVITSLIRKVFFSVITILFATNSFSADLVRIYALAEKNDPVYQQEISTHRAILESKPQAWSQLLPSLDISANTRRNAQDITTSGSSIGADGEIDFNSHGYSLNLSQPLFRRDRFIALSQADSQIKESEAKLAKSQQNLIVSVSESYFNVLRGLDNLVFAEIETKSLNRQLEQANQRFEVGLSAITDVQEAQAGYDLAVAQEIVAINAIDNAKEEIRELTGEYIDDFDGLSENIALIRPDPEEIDSFIAVTENDQTNLLSALLAKHLGVRQTLIHVSTTEYIPAMKVIGLDAVVSKNMCTVTEILEYIKSDEKHLITNFEDVEVEAIELRPNPGSIVTRKILGNIKFPNSSIIGSINHRGHVSIPHADTQISDEDSVLVFSLPSAISKVEKLFD